MSQQPYSFPVSKLLTLGEPKFTNDLSLWLDYASLGITTQHAPELAQMAVDENLNFANSESAEVWAPVHAIRALGQQHSEIAIEPLLALMRLNDDDDGDVDDWISTDLPLIFGEIGPIAIPVLQDYLFDETHGDYTRSWAASGLTKIAIEHPDIRPDCIKIIGTVLEKFETNTSDLNGLLIYEMVALKAVEYAPLLERIFAADKVDLLLNGDWEDVQVRLGLKAGREFPRQHSFFRGESFLERHSDNLEQNSHPKQLPSRDTIRLKAKKEKAKRKAADKAKKKRKKK